MALFFNQRKPKPFNFTPRYFSPEQEAREERKKIVLGVKYRAPGEEDRKEEYVPGSFIRQQVNARRNNTENEMFRRRKRKRQSITILVVALVVLVLVVWLFYFK